MVMNGAGLSSESKVSLKDNKLKPIRHQRPEDHHPIRPDQRRTISYLPDDKIATKLKIEEYQGQDTLPHRLCREWTA
jgi:ribosomal protein L32